VVESDRIETGTENRLFTLNTRSDQGPRPEQRRWKPTESAHGFWGKVSGPMASRLGGRIMVRLGPACLFFLCFGSDDVPK